jgi:pentatricopeptide repeat protein
MMDCYSRAGVIDEVKMIFEQLTNNVVANNILIKTYGKFDMATRATALLKSMLHGPGVDPNIRSFNSALAAWVRLDIGHDAC